MKEFALLFIGTILISFSVNGQSVSIGVRGGASIPNLTTSSNNPTSKGYSSKFGGDAAIFANFKFSDMFSIQPMLEFSQQGGKNDFPAIPVGQVTDKIGDKLPDFVDEDVIEEAIGQKHMYLKSDSKAKLNYLMLPVLAKFGWDIGNKSQSNLRFYADAGPFVSYLVSAHQEYSNTKSEIYASRDTDDPLEVGGQSVPDLINTFLDEDVDIPSEIDGDQDIYSDVKNWNVGISGNLGFSYHFERSQVFIEGGGNYGFINIQKDPKNGENHTGAGTVSFGYAYQL